MCIGLHVNYSFLLDINETLIYQQVFKKYSNMKFHENLSNGSQVFPCRQTDGWTDRHNKDNSYFSQFCERT